tara:strand:+ start:391 stop:639 length:249 start_codon:yes stop_codon:yes gene_type:complete
MTKKKTEKKADEQKYTDEMYEDLQRSALTLQANAQNIANQLVQHQQLCSHYEQTINVLTGRLQEQQKLVTQLRQQLQTKTEE